MLVGGLVLIYGAVGFYFLPMASFQGDLTRTGMLPESQFGWRKIQPVIDPKWMQQATLRDADVLVIGDSFSDGRIWQTALTRRGLKVRTESWDSLRGVCEDFAPWLRAQGFAGKYVVLEMIERNITDGMEKFVACQKMQSHPNVSADAPRFPSPISFDPDHGGFHGRFSVGIQTMLNFRRYETLSSGQDFQSAVLPNDTKVARVRNGCLLFSHTRCNDSLFLGTDKASEIETGVLKNIEILNNRMAGITPIWTFVPNKSTAYLYPNKQFWEQAERRFLAPNLLRMTQQAIQSKTVDLYPANNTHFSTTGYLLMGEEIYKTIQQVQSSH